MQRTILVALFLALVAYTAPAHAQLFFQTTFDQYEHPKSEWERWSKCQPGDFVEYSDTTKVFARLEVMEVGDQVVKVRTSTLNDLTGRPIVKEIRHLFGQDEPTFGLPTSKTDDKLKLGETEFTAQRHNFDGPDGKPIKQVWYSDEVPLDGMLKYLQYTHGEPSAQRYVARYRFGEKTFGPTDDKPTPFAEKPANNPANPASPMPTTTPAGDDPAPATDDPAVPAADSKLRTWTSADGKQTIEAELVRLTATGVVLKRADDDKTFSLTLRQLSAADRAYLQELRKTMKK